MIISRSVSRFAAYYRRNGWWATFRRLALAMKRAFSLNQMVLFYCDLSEQGSWAPVSPSSVTIERKSNEAALSTQDFTQIINCWNPILSRRNIGERFRQGASLWTIKSEGGLAGYGWTVKGHTIEPHFFPLAQEDVHLFDFFIFPRYRGRGMNPTMVTHILRGMAAEARGRAYIEAADWNSQQLSSLAKTPFRRLSRARKLTIFRHTIVCWTKT